MVDFGFSVGFCFAGVHAAFARRSVACRCVSLSVCVCVLFSLSFRIACNGLPARQPACLLACLIQPRTKTQTTRKPKKGARFSLVATDRHGPFWISVEPVKWGDLWADGRPDWKFTRSLENEKHIVPSLSFLLCRFLFPPFVIWPLSSVVNEKRIVQSACPNVGLHQSIKTTSFLCFSILVAFDLLSLSLLLSLLLDEQNNDDNNNNNNMI